MPRVSTCPCTPCLHHVGRGCGTVHRPQLPAPHASPLHTPRLPSWVNNCVAGPNYPSFLALLLLTCGLLALQAGAGAALMVGCFTQGPRTQAALAAAYPTPVNLWGYFAGLAVYTAVRGGHPSPADRGRGREGGKAGAAVGRQPSRPCSEGVAAMQGPGPSVTRRAGCQGACTPSPGSSSGSPPPPHTHTR